MTGAPGKIPVFLMVHPRLVERRSKQLTQMQECKHVTLTGCPTSIESLSLYRDPTQYTQPYEEITDFYIHSVISQKVMHLPKIL